MRVYVIGSEQGPFKVGISQNPDRRAAAFQGASAGRLTVLYASDPMSEDMARDIEAAAHRKLYMSNVGGEWFNCEVAEVMEGVRWATANYVAGHREGYAKSEPMSAEAFTAWVEWAKREKGWSNMRCSTELGCGENQIRTWKAKGAPNYIGLACAAISYGLPAWSQPRAS